MAKLLSCADVRQALNKKTAPSRSYHHAAAATTTSPVGKHFPRIAAATTPLPPWKVHNKDLLCRAPRKKHTAKSYFACAIKRARKVALCRASDYKNRTATCRMHDELPGARQITSFW
jgi:hypothetical protein